MDDPTLSVSVLKLRTAANTYVSGAATNSGNFKVSLEEFENDISVNSNSQLKTTPYTSTGKEGITLADSGNLDAFYRLRISNPFTIFDSKQISDNITGLFWDNTEASGSGTTFTYSQNRASTTLSVSNATAGKRVRQ